ncbi:hypothetical protein A5814_002762 [Enterococcus faecium]|nr:hypothetical protein A5814_002762 [Enterococcus faecium]
MSLNSLSYFFLTILSYEMVVVIPSVLVHIWTNEKRKLCLMGKFTFLLLFSLPLIIIFVYFQIIKLNDSFMERIGFLVILVVFYMQILVIKKWFVSR